MSTLYQFRFEYNAEEDRVLLRVSTTDHAEYLVWFTRRYVRQLWRLLDQAVDAHPDVARQHSSVAKRSVAAFHRESALSRTDFSREYEIKSVERPIGDQPILATRARLSMNPQGMRVLHFAPARGKEVSISLTDELLHSFCHILAEIVAKAEWDLNIVSAEPAVEVVPARLH